jgi:hypothetical protein
MSDCRIALCNSFRVPFGVLLGSDDGLGRSGRQPFERTPTHEGCAFWASDGDAWNAENRSELVCLVALLVEGMALRISAHPQQDTF